MTSIYDIFNGLYFPALNRTLLFTDFFMEEKNTILIVEDDVLVSAVISKLLRTAGYEVLAASTGKEAINLFRHAHDKIDVVFMDYLLPDINGLDVAIQMRKYDKYQ